ncbi:MAG: type II/IV secretion system protein [Proteobacteria bacterium]|nr:type II/IV secretion system protein [Pseudomonadota bacterium]
MNTKDMSREDSLVLSGELKISPQQLAFCSNAEARKLITLEQALKYKVLPTNLLQDSGERLLTCLGVSGDPEIVKEIKFITNAELLIEQVDADILEQAIFLAYKGEQDSLQEGIVKANQTIPDKKDRNFISLSEEQAVPQLLERIIFRAHYLQASDIHLESTSKGYQLRLRIDGLLRNEKSFSVNKTVAENLIRRIKILANLDITQNTQPQEGGFTSSLGKTALNCRISIIPAIYGEKVVIRILERSEFGVKKDIKRRLFDLGMNLEQAKILISMLNQNTGAILLAGPTGSGKTTLLYAALEYLNQEWRNIITLEDPVERRLDGINQIQITNKEDFSFSQMLSQILRQDPDVIMLGEIRDCETAQTAMNAAITGHLVLSTVHAGDCFQVLTRLKHLQLKSDLLASALKLIIAQRLIPLNCAKCLVEEKSSAEVSKFFHFPEQQVLKFSTGCNYCEHSGIRGRVGVFEFLPITLKIQEIFLTYKHNIELLAKTKELASAGGFVPLAFGIRELLKEGKISTLTAFRALGVASELIGSIN